MWLRNNHPWFSLVKTWIPMDEVSWGRSCHRWDDADDRLALFEGVDPSDVVDVLLRGFVEVVSVVLAWEAVIMWINTFNNPPFSDNR